MNLPTLSPVAQKLPRTHTTSHQVRRMLAPMLLAALCWPLTEGVGALLMRYHGAFQTVFLRYATHLFMLVPFALFTRGRIAFRTSRLALQLLRGFCMFLMPLCFVAAIRFTDIRSFWMMFWCLPLIVLACARMLGERIGARAASATALACIVAVLISIANSEHPFATLVAIPTAFNNLPALLLVLCTTASFAAYLALSRILRSEQLTASLFYTALGAIAPMAVLAAFAWTPIVAADVVPAFMLGGFSILLLTGFDLALEAATLSLVAPAIALIPLIEFALIVMLSEGR